MMERDAQIDIMNIEYYDWVQNVRHRQCCEHNALKTIEARCQIANVEIINTSVGLTPFCMLQTIVNERLLLHRLSKQSINYTVYASSIETSRTKTSSLISIPGKSYSLTSVLPLNCTKECTRNMTVTVLNTMIAFNSDYSVPQLK